MAAEPQERATRDGSVYGLDCNNVAAPKYDQITFSRMYRHRVILKGAGQTKSVTSATQCTGTGGWQILPIQNAVQAAVKPRDWVALNNLSCKWRVKNFSVECTNFNAQALTASTESIQNTTIPNLFLECYVDIDHDLPGYEEDFLYTYGTNRMYSTGDDSYGGDGDLELRDWTWFNSLDRTFLPQTNLNLLNGRGYKFVKQTDDFRFVWEVEPSERHWRHVGQPWQYQNNPHVVDPNDAPESYSGGLFNSNLSWGGFPGGRKRLRTVGRAATLDDDQKSGGGRLYFETAGKMNTNKAGTTSTVLANGANHGRSFPFDTYWDYGTKASPKWTRLYNTFDGGSHMQISGIPVGHTPPPLIMFRPNKRKGEPSVYWEFFCKYTCTFEYRRNQFGFDPMDQSGSNTWAGTGNLGFISVPGAGRYGAEQDPPSRWSQPFGYPNDTSQNSGAWKPYGSFTPGVTTRGQRKRALEEGEEDPLIIAEDEGKSSKD